VDVRSGTKASEQFDHGSVNRTSSVPGAQGVPKPRKVENRLHMRMYIQLKRVARGIEACTDSIQILIISTLFMTSLALAARRRMRKIRINHANASGTFMLELEVEFEHECLEQS
jgi:hypothetical protein